MTSFTNKITKNYQPFYLKIIHQDSDILFGYFKNIAIAIWWNATEEAVQYYLSQFGSVAEKCGEKISVLNWVISKKVRRVSLHERTMIREFFQNYSSRIVTQGAIIEGSPLLTSVVRLVIQTASIVVRNLNNINYYGSIEEAQKDFPDKANIDAIVFSLLLQELRALSQTQIAE